jgi:prepilin-type N-terminal cleavage/methylation domain-containing protein
MVKWQASQRGYSMVELMLAIAIGLIVVGMAMGNVQGLTKNIRADGGLATVAAGLRGTREAAIGNRRNVRLTFGTNTITLTRVEYCPATCTTGGSGTWSTFPGCTSTCTSQTTALRTVTLEGRAEFRLMTGVPDTPDGFGMASATAFGSLVPPMFTSDGSFINSNGDVLNGTVFIGVPGDTLSARAVTIFGATGAMRLWKWNGRAWVEA